MYWWLRAALAPLVLLNMAFSGILQASPSALRDAPLNTGLSAYIRHGHHYGSILTVLPEKDACGLCFSPP